MKTTATSLCLCCLATVCAYAGLVLGAPPAAGKPASPAARRPAAPAAVIAPPPAAAPAASAPASYVGGMALLEAGRFVEARAALSAALWSGQLSGPQESQAVRTLTELANTTIFSREVYAGDPYAFYCTVAPGDTLARLSRRRDVGVPADVLAQINALDPARLAAGARLKLIRGPFRACITKSRFALDVYLELPGKPRVFIQRMPVAVGRDDSTPQGAWRVAGKAARATWNPPPSMAEEIKGPVRWGQKHYPLGKDGIFISLAGLEGQARGMKGFGLHGTSDPASIGHARSHGCIRLRDGDVRRLYALLSEGQSTVVTRN